MSDSRLEGRTIVVTGAAQGIGAAILEHALGLGANVVAVDLNGDRLRDTCEPHGRRVQAHVGDVSDGGFTKHCVDRALAHFGAIHGLVNNAGITRPALIEKMTLDQWRQVLEVHLTGAFLWTQAVGSHMVDRATAGERSPGSIVNNSSTAGLRGTIGQINYATAKAGLLGLSMATAREWARHGIRANTVCFGVVETPMTETIRGERFREQMLAGIPMGRFSQPSEVAPTICFLLSDDASYITGQYISVDGGIHTSI